jgi:FlaA1/EpsC-like NDP-sugar epimerase
VKNNLIENPWKGRTVLITGVCGTVGRELLRQVVKRGPAEVIGLENNESELFFLAEEYQGYTNVYLDLGDVRDRDKLLRKTRGVDIILHAAALKHVLLCEREPRDAVQTNILGTQNIIDAALTNSVQRVIFTSSDKAVNPTNVMGTSKLMGERLVTAANAHKRGNGPIFLSTRFGNVLGSRGSVIPLFKRQIQRGGPVTITDPKMTRFIMSLEEAVHLVMDSVFLAKGGEVFVTKMPVARISDLGHVMVQELAPKYGYEASGMELRVIGARPGEKLYEELLNEEEIRRTLELERYFVIKPAFQSSYEKVEYTYPNTIQECVTRPYNSSVEACLSRDELRTFLVSNSLLDRG